MTNGITYVPWMSNVESKLGQIGTKFDKSGIF